MPIRMILSLLVPLCSIIFFQNCSGSAHEFSNSVKSETSKVQINDNDLGAMFPEVIEEAELPTEEETQLISENLPEEEIVFDMIEPSPTIPPYPETDEIEFINDSYVCRASHSTTRKKLRKLEDNSTLCDLDFSHLKGSGIIPDSKKLDSSLVTPFPDSKVNGDIIVLKASRLNLLRSPKIENRRLIVVPQGQQPLQIKEVRMGKSYNMTICSGEIKKVSGSSKESLLTVVDTKIDLLENFTSNILLVDSSAELLKNRFNNEDQMLISGIQASINSSIVLYSKKPKVHNIKQVGVGSFFGACRKKK